MKFFKSKFFLVTLGIALLVAAVFTAMTALGYSSYIKQGLNYALVPIQKLSDAVGRSLDGYASYITEFDKLRAENAQLKEQLGQLQDEVYSAEALKEQNEFYRQYLQIKSEHLDYQFEDAQVVGRQAGNYMTVFTLSRGTSHGIEVNMLLIASNGGLIGYITDAGTTWSKASSILDSSASVGVYVERNLQTGIVSGDYSLGMNGLMKLSYLPQDTDIQVGDRIMTSGLSSIYPRGLVVGTVSEVVTDDSGRTVYAIIKPYADITDLSSVMVVTKFEKYVEK